MGMLIQLILDVLLGRHYTVYAIARGREEYRGRYRTFRGARRRADDLLDRPLIDSVKVERNGIVWEEAW